MYVRSFCMCPQSVSSAAIRTDIAAIVCAVVLACAGLAGKPAAAIEPTTLDAVAADVAKRWPGIGHVSPAEVDALMRSGDVAVFDVRKRDEQEVSHLQGATLVDPDMPAPSFLARYGEAIKGKTVVFYCSVGVRSSKLADRVAAGLTHRGANAVTNLRGGIFAWHAERRPLENARGATDDVHPYDRNWGRLVERRQPQSSN